MNKNEINDTLLSGCDCIIFGSPRLDFSTDEFEALQKFVGNSGTIAFFLGQDSEEAIINNVNSFMKEYGIRVETDKVIGTTYFKYLHPKHVLISNGIVHPALFGSKVESSDSSQSDSFTQYYSSNLDDTELMEQSDFYGEKDTLDTDNSLSFVYPNGVTMDIQPPAITILSSGPISFPGNRPIAAIWQDETKAFTPEEKLEKGRIMVMGSSDSFSDMWLEKEDNSTLCEKLLDYLLDRNSIQFDRSQALREVDEKKCVPNIASMATKVQSCLQEGEVLPQDINSLFSEDLFEYKNNLIPETIEMYDKLNVKHEPLSLILPEFECPLPKLQPSYFVPHLRDPPPPSLDQFDLDEHFANERVRLAQLANKCIADDDLLYYVEEAKEILGLGSAIVEEGNNSNHVLSSIFKKVRCRFWFIMFVSREVRISISDSFSFIFFCFCNNPRSSSSR